ncbi:molybdopterin biosynthesis protein [Mongoliimonas terrestris]|uniref:molybdopterin biosynthesis protein n=1 Tax=Mongoliimonas terrestris TaxID=1709001 RepID=UPI0009F878D3|nr:molybdopterin biosynthesis protein [Mongoliimonas terrestris]
MTETTGKTAHDIAPGGRAPDGSARAGQQADGPAKAGGTRAVGAPDGPAAGGVGLAQDQFLSVVSRDEAAARFRAALRPRPVGTEMVALADSLGRVLAADVAAPVDAPPFDRAVVDGFAVRAADLTGASEAAPVRLRLTGETIACGVSPTRPVATGMAATIATGGPIPRGADAVVMIEWTEPDPIEAGVVRVGRPVLPGQNVSFAGSDIARGEILIRRGSLIGAREIGMLATVGLASVPVVRRPVVAVLSTGDELVAPGEALRPAAVYDANGPMVAAAVAENGCVPLLLGAIPDDAAALRAAIDDAFERADAVILSGGTSKGAGDLTYRLVAGLGEPGIVVHGVALKPGKPLLLAVADGKPVVVLPGFPTSAMFTFHDLVAPVLRLMAGLPERAETTVTATLPARVPSDLGRTEFVMVSLIARGGERLAYPLGKGSGAVTAFGRADGFFSIDALADHALAGATVAVTLLSGSAEAPDLAIVGSHCVGLDAVTGVLADGGWTSRVVPVGSLGGLAALKRGECDLAPIHLIHPETGRYNVNHLDPDMTLIPGWLRRQGIVFRADDGRFAGRDLDQVLALVATVPDLLMVNRNAGSGTRLLMDRLLKGLRPAGYWNQPKSHNAVGAAVAQGRADWGLAIEPVARDNGLGFLAVGPEHYDFAARTADLDRPAMAAFRAALDDPAVAERLAALGFTRANGNGVSG